MYHATKLGKIVDNAMAPKKSVVLNTTAKPAGGPNGQSPIVDQKPNALQNACDLAAAEILQFISFPRPANMRSRLAAIIYRHMREQREI